MENRTSVANGAQTVRQLPGVVDWSLPERKGTPRLAYGLVEAAELACVSTEVIRRAIHAGEGYLRARRVGRKFLILHDDLVKWLESLPDV